VLTGSVEPQTAALNKEPLSSTGSHDNYSIRHVWNIGRVSAGFGHTTVDQRSR
jgi:hypothetical protein